MAEIFWRGCALPFLFGAMLLNFSRKESICIQLSFIRNANILGRL